MNFQFTHPLFLLALPLAWAWVIWLTLRSDVSVSAPRRWTAMGVRLIVVTLLILAVAGMQWRRPIEGMNLFFVLDRSDSIPAAQQEQARKYVNRASERKERADRAGVVVFGTDAGVEFSPAERVQLKQFHTVVGSDRTDLGAAIRLATAAFPETGQKRLVLMTDGNENLGDALGAALAAVPLGVSIDVVPLGVARADDVSVQKVTLPAQTKKGQTFEVRIVAEADEPQPATVRLYRNDQYLGEQEIQLVAGKNPFSFPETLTEPGFYSYDVAIEVTLDQVPQNNRVTSFTRVRGDPRILVVSDAPPEDAALVQALRESGIETDHTDLSGFPGTLAEMQSYDSIFISNIAAGDLGRDLMRLLASAVRDFGVGLVCIGGDQAYAAGGYRGTPLEEALPVDMELSSKKVLPNGALVLIMHGMEFNNGNQIARNIAIGTLEALGPQDEMGVILWDGTERWLFPLTKVGDKRELGRKIAGMNQGDLPSFQNVMTMAYEGLRESSAHLKHIIVFSDGDPGAPSDALMESIVADRITVSSVLIAGHAGPATMISIAEKGNGRFYDVRSPEDLPQIFIKEASVILKSAIFEEPFQPQLAARTELVRGIGDQEFPQLLGYVATTAKPRAEIPLLSEKGDPLLAHWQFGLGRAAAFTSDAKARWAQNWLGWPRYQQFWSQVANWSLRRLENADLLADVTIEKGQGRISVEALDAEGNYRNFLNLQAVVVSPKGESRKVLLEQSGAGHYDASFTTREEGMYLVHLMEIEKGELRSSQTLGAGVNYSPEFMATQPNLNLLQRLADTGSGKILDLDVPSDGPFHHDRRKTFQPQDLWEWLLRLAIILFPIDVGIRRVQIERAEWLRATATLRRWLFFWQGPPRAPEADESLAALLARRDDVRARRASASMQPNPDLFRPERPASSPVQPGPAERGPVVAAPPESPPPETKTEPVQSTTSRLLDAKRRAQKR